MSKPKLEIVSDDLVWLEFAGKEIRIAHDEDDESILITVHNPEEDYHARLLFSKDEVYP